MEADMATKIEQRHGLGVEEAWGQAWREYYQRAGWTDETAERLAIDPICDHGAKVVGQIGSVFEGANAVRLYADGCQGYGPYPEHAPMRVIEDTPGTHAAQPIALTETEADVAGWARLLAGLPEDRYVEVVRRIGNVLEYAARQLHSRHGLNLADILAGREPQLTREPLSFEVADANAEAIASGKLPCVTITYA